MMLLIFVYIIYVIVFSNWIFEIYLRFVEKEVLINRYFGLIEWYNFVL